MRFVELVAALSSSDVNIPKAEINDAQFQGIISTILMIAGIVSVIFIILGGIRYAISQGNAQDLNKGKDMIIYSLVGLFFVIFAFIIVQFVTANIF